MEEWKKMIVIYFVILDLEKLNKPYAQVGDSKSMKSYHK